MKVQTVTLQCDLGALGHAVDVEFRMLFLPGAPASGAAGLPEYYDSGSADVVNIRSAVVQVGARIIDLAPFFQAEIPDTVYDALCEAGERAIAAERDEALAARHTHPLTERIAA